MDSANIDSTARHLRIDLQDNDHPNGMDETTTGGTTDMGETVKGETGALVQETLAILATADVDIGTAARIDSEADHGHEPATGTTNMDGGDITIEIAPVREVEAEAEADHPTLEGRPVEMLFSKGLR